MQVAVGVLNGSTQHIVCNLDTVKFRIGFPQPLQHGIAELFIRLGDLHRLKAAFQCAVLADGGTEFAGRGGTDQPNLATCQLWLEHVGSINGTLRSAGPHNGVQLVDKQNDVPVFGCLCQAVFQAFLKIAPIFCAGE